MNAREAILKRIKAADPSFASAPSGTEPVAVPVMSSEDRLNEFKKRFLAVGGVYHQVSEPDAIRPVLAEILADKKGLKVAADDSAVSIVPNLAEYFQDLGMIVTPPLPEDARDAAVGITASERALAYSGSLLVTSLHRGELAASLLSPVHIALTPRSVLVDGVPDLLACLDRLGWPRGAALITGPSRTADIELTLVTGVHGPSEVHVILLDYV